jgi:VIT1/CCC1 family predicted Fe2+/Mn2+ transporter
MGARTWGQAPVLHRSGVEMSVSPEIQEQLLLFQKNEITEHHIYRDLAKRVRPAENRRILEKIAADELRHYQEWKEYTGQEVRPSRFQVWKYYWISRVFGFTFGIKLMEQGEEGAQDHYHALRHAIPQAAEIARDEGEHEASLIELLDEERLRYTGSIVLGLNDALVELTGALAGLTLALQNTRLIALTGLITGIAAALSMGASEYLSTKAEETAGNPAGSLASEPAVSQEGSRNPLRASIYTGITYIVTVFILILPYLFLANYYVCLAFTLLAAITIIGFFNYYISVARDVPFRPRFVEMSGLSLSIAALSFIIGFIMRSFFNVDI